MVKTKESQYGVKVSRGELLLLGKVFSRLVFEEKINLGISFSIG